MSYKKTKHTKEEREEALSRGIELSYKKKVSGKKRKVSRSFPHRPLVHT